MKAPRNLSRPTCMLLVDHDGDKMMKMSSEIESLELPVVMMQPASARALLERERCLKCNDQFDSEDGYALDKCTKRCRVEESSTQKELQCLDCLKEFTTAVALALARHCKEHKRERTKIQVTLLRAENIKLERALRESIAVPSIIALGSTSATMFEDLQYKPKATVVDLDSAGVMQEIEKKFQ